MNDEWNFPLQPLQPAEQMGEQNPIYGNEDTFAEMFPDLPGEGLLIGGDLPMPYFSQGASMPDNEATQCWGALLSGSTSCMPSFLPGKGHFKNHVRALSLCHWPVDSRSRSVPLCLAVLCDVPRRRNQGAAAASSRLAAEPAPAV